MSVESVAVEGVAVENLIPLGVVAVFVGMILIVVGALLSASKQSRTEGGFVFFLGPIPIIGATSKTMLYAVIALSIFVLIFFLIFNRGLIK